MDNKIEKIIQDLYKSTNDYDVKSLLLYINMYLKEQKHRILLSELQLEGELWNKDNW